MIKHHCTWWRRLANEIWRPNSLNKQHYWRWRTLANACFSKLTMSLSQLVIVSILRLSFRTLSCLYTSRRCVILLCVCNLPRVPVFSKCSFLLHSAYFHSALYPSFRRKNPQWIFRKLPVHNFPHSAFRVPQNTPSPHRQSVENFVLQGLTLLRNVGLTQLMYNVGEIGRRPVNAEQTHPMKERTRSRSPWTIRSRELFMVALCNRADHYIFLINWS